MKRYIPQNKENMFQQPSQAAWLTATFRTAEWNLHLVNDKTTKNKPRVDYEPRSAHGRAVNKGWDTCM